MLLQDLREQRYKMVRNVNRKKSIKLFGENKKGKMNIKRRNDSNNLETWYLRRIDVHSINSDDCYFDSN